MNFLTYEGKLIEVKVEEPISAETIFGAALLCHHAKRKKKEEKGEKKNVPIDKFKRRASAFFHVVNLFFVLSPMAIFHLKEPTSLCQFSLDSKTS